MKLNLALTAIVVSMLLFSSCKTYYISVGSFKQQFGGLDSSGLKRVITKDPFGGEATYKTYRTVASNIVMPNNSIPIVVPRLNFS